MEFPTDSVHAMPETGHFYVNGDVMRDFETNGYILVRGMFSSEEICKIRDCCERSESIRANAYGREDGHGRKSRLCVWNYAGDDVTGVAARSEKIAGTMQALLGGDEVYHYHTKLMMKEARTGGAFVWHQDYGYWYGNGCILPEMGSVFMPIDRCVKENGCLQVLKGSHRLGRIDHGLTGKQAGADEDRLELAKRAFPLVHVEIEPGDVLFFHCNLLHTSDMRRYVMITAFNKRMNSPEAEHHHPRYHPLRMLPNSAIMECQVFDPTVDKWYMDPNIDTSYNVRNPSKE